jgi:hypothetical protein
VGDFSAWVAVAMPAVKLIPPSILTSPRVRRAENAEKVEKNRGAAYASPPPAFLGLPAAKAFSA